MSPRGGRPTLRRRKRASQELESCVSTRGLAEKNQTLYEEDVVSSAQGPYTAREERTQLGEGPSRPKKCRKAGRLHQTVHSSPKQRGVGSDEPSWENKYKSLAAQVRQLLNSEFLNSHEKELRSAREKQKEAEQIQSDAEYRMQKLEKDIADERKTQYFRDFDPEPSYGGIGRSYLQLNRSLSSICRVLGRLDVISAFDEISKTPEFWEIASPGVEQWMRKLLETCNSERMRGWAVQSILLAYILRTVFKPMLIGLDREAEVLLTCLADNLQATMSPSVADRWIAETLYSYSSLPTYSRNHDFFLQTHTAFLQDFIGHLLTKESNESRPGLTYLKRRIERLQQSVMVPAADMALEMSFTYPKFFVDWQYCETRTEMTRGDLVDHRLLCSQTGQYLRSENFRNLDSDQEKIADVIMLVAPPIFMIKRVGPRKLVGKPIIVVSPIAEYEDSPDSAEEMAITDILRKQLC